MARTKSARRPQLATRRLNLYLPREVVDELRQYVPAGERTRFVAQALARELRRVKLLAAIDASAGAWREEDHPELTSGAAIDRWVEKERETLGWDRALEDDHG